MSPVASDEPIPVIVVNGFCFCEEHGWEYCQTCTYDFRDLNNEVCLVPELSEVEPEGGQVKVAERFDLSMRTQQNAYTLGAVKSARHDTEEGEEITSFQCSKHDKVDCSKCFDWVAIYRKEAMESRKRKDCLEPRASN